MSRRRNLAVVLGTALATTGLIATPARLAGAEPVDLPVVVTEQNDPILDALVAAGIPATAAEQGAWSSAIDWPLLPIHAAVMPDGSVVTYGTPNDSQVQEARILDIWNPDEGTAPLSHLTVPNGGTVESFCALAVLLGNGDFLIAGGNTPLGSAIYDYATRSAREVSRLHQNRWYGTMTMLPDGRPLVTGGIEPYRSGLGDDADYLVEEGRIGLTPEVYDPATGWTLLDGATSREAFGPELHKWWYPRQWVAPDGRVFGLTADTMYYLDVSGNGSITMAGKFKTPADVTTKPNIGATSTAAMYAPGKILQVGGNGYVNDYPTPSSALASIIDITGGTPVVTETTPMLNARQWATATVLPTGTVFVNGGTTYANLGGANRVLAGELWDPATGQWTTMASAAYARLYHSSSILLPSGAVFTGGGGSPGPEFNQNVELYYPPYFFERQGTVSVLADRPSVTRMSAEQLGYGSSLVAEVDSAKAVAEVSLIGLGSTTHSTDMGQRRMTLPFTQTGDRLAIAAPSSANDAPPGFYLMSVVDADGVPSAGVIVGIGTSVPGTLKSPTTSTTTTTTTTTTVPPSTTAPASTTTTATTTGPAQPTTTTPAPTSTIGTAATRAAGFVALTPQRVLDTRPDTRTGYSGDKPTPDQTIVVHLTDLPTDATAATLNITGTDPTNNGYVTVWPCDTPRPNTSTLNLTRGITSPNAVITKISNDRTICIYTEAGTHLLADLTGALR